MGLELMALRRQMFQLRAPGIVVSLRIGRQTFSLQWQGRDGLTQN